jgi:hypothetical protein
VTQTRLAILESFPVQVQLSIQGTLPDSCMVIEDISSQRSEGVFWVEITTQRLEGACEPGPIPFQEQIALEVVGLPAGEYQVDVEGVRQSFSLAVDNVLPTDQPPQENRLDLGGGVSLVVPAAVGGLAELGQVEGQAEGDNLMPFANYPDRMEITFPAYPLTGTFHDPRIELYPLDETMAMNPAAADSIAELQGLLENPPSTLPDPLPFLPIFNAGPMMQAQETVVRSEGVDGVRYLTQYGQALYPVNNRDLFYTFQGLTRDGSYYLLAVLPVNHPELPATGDDFLGLDPQDFFEQAESYFVETEALLDGQPTGAFTPDLGSLDQMLQSIRIE